MNGTARIPTTKPGDFWDAKGAHADRNETKKRDDAEKNVAHTADSIQSDLLIN